MRLSTKRLSLAALLIGALASLLPADDRAVAAAIGDKQSRLLAVVAELRSRPSLEWSADRLLARQRTLDLLERYAHQADFTVHHAAWPRDLPLFIDEHGTRCALASVLDGVGEGALVLQLAATCNDAYLNEIAADPAVVATLDRLGITLDEAAYIQGPGIRFDSPEPTFTGPTGLTGNSLDNGVGGPPNETTGRGRPGITGAAAGVTRRANGDATGLSVTGWWAANLDRFLPVRELYRGESAQTPAVTPGNWRVSGDERAALRGRLAELARSDRDLKATALGMWARTSDGSDAPAIVTETLALLADPHHPDRAWAPLLLAILGREEASAALAAMVADDAAGRKLVGGAAGVPEDLRALAAIALGRSGSAVGPLTAALRDAPSAHVDLAAACVVGLGLAARRPQEQVAATAALLAALEDPALPATVVAQVPAALVLADATAALPRLHEIVQRFRGPRELRAAAAHAISGLARELDGDLLDALLGVAKRDVDVAARHAAILALGELAAKSGPQLDAKLAATVATFQFDGVQGRLRHAADVPWHAIAAGLFARGGHPLAREVVARLREVADEAAALDARAAAMLALGLARDRESLSRFRREVAGAAITPVMVNAIYATGLVGASAERDALLAFCRDSADPRLGFAAAYSLGCLADASILPPLVDALVATNSEPVRGALSRALGEIGDRRVVPALEGIAFDAEHPDPTRERALAALGVAAQHADVAWNAPLRHALFAGTSTPTLAFVSSLF